MLRKQKAQAVLELAILGSLIIMAFAIVISKSENYNREQSYLQQTFRATLYKAQEANDTASVSTVDYRRMPNVTNPMEIGEFQQFSSGNSVLWSDGKDYASQSKQYFLHNRSSYQPIASGASGVIPGSISVSGSGYTTNLKSDNIFDKKENGNNIRTTKDLNAQDTVSGGATVGDQRVVTGGDLITGGRYGFDGLGVLRNREMR